MFASALDFSYLCPNNGECCYGIFHSDSIRPHGVRPPQPRDVPRYPDTGRRRAVGAGRYRQLYLLRYADDFVAGRRFRPSVPIPCQQAAP